VTKFTDTTSKATTNFTQGISVRHVAEKHRDKLGPAGKALRMAFRLMFCHQLSKLSSRKMMKKLTKQAGTFYHEYALFGGCREIFIGVKILHHKSPRGYFV